MPLTEKEQKRFEKMFHDMLDVKGLSDKQKLKRLSNLLFELTGNVNLAQWLNIVAEKVK